MLFSCCWGDIAILLKWIGLVFNGLKFDSVFGAAMWVMFRLTEFLLPSLILFMLPLCCDLPTLDLLVAFFSLLRTGFKSATGGFKLFLLVPRSFIWIDWCFWCKVKLAVAASGRVPYCWINYFCFWFIDACFWPLLWSLLLLYSALFDY